jgi:hypothetical protein
MTRREKIRLLFGPYLAPKLKRGDRTHRTHCLLRGGPVVICGWSKGRIPWPICYAVGNRGTGRGLLIDRELARAIRHESSTAVQHWWGISRSAVRHWRRALSVGRTDSEGSRRLIHGAIESTLTARRCPGGMWTQEEMELLGKLTDAEVASRIGRSANAVSMKRRHIGQPAVRTKPQR